MANWLDAIFGNPDGSKSGAGANATVDGKNAVVERTGDEVRIYTAGPSGDPLGAGHGDIVMNTSGQVAYVREPSNDGSRNEPIISERQGKQ